VFEFDAAILIAFVLATRPEFRALLLATDVGTLEIFAGDLLLDSSAAALDVRAFRARWTLTDVTGLRASVR
jgi:hypothetical protein